MARIPSIAASYQVGLVSILALVSGALWLGCSASASVPNDRAGDQGDSSRDGTGATPRPDAANAMDSAVMASAACVHYCDTVQTACNVDNPQFPTMDSCLRVCALYPPGAPTDPYGTGDTLHCRQDHADSSLGNARAHCHHGGPYGYGGCGDMCGAFCRIAMSWCAGSPGGAPFASAAACQTECEAWPQSADAQSFPAYNTSGPTSGNSLECHEYQLIKATESYANRDMYCPRAASNGVPCN